ncbi:hypothetical protein Bca4012_052162 [Brassica carinata]
MMIKLIKSMFQAITRQIQNLIISYLRYLPGYLSLTNTKHDHYFTLIIEHSGEFGRENGSTVLALSGLLCSLVLGTPWGEARIIVIFTTNNKDMLDPTLLSRISVDIYMVHCCFEGFKVLASNYWGLSHVNDDEPHPHRLSRHQAFD